MRSTQDDSAGTLDGGRLGFGAHHVTALALVDRAGGDGGVGVPERVHNLAHAEAVAGHLLERDNDAQFAFAAAPKIDLGNAGHPLQAVGQDIGDEVAVGVNVARVPERAANAEAGDGAVVRARGPHGRIAGLGRQVGDAAETVGHQQEGTVQILFDDKLEGDPGPPGQGGTGHIGDAFDARQLFFQAGRDLALDLGRRRAGPRGGDLDDRALHVGGELNGDRLQGHHPEGHDHQYGGDHSRRTIDRHADEIHRRLVPS